MKGRLGLKRFSQGLLAAVLMICIVTPNIYAEEKSTIDEKTEKFRQLFETILNDYNGSDITEDELWEAAVQGMFSALDDYSDFYEVNQYDTMVESISGEYVGVGIEMIVNGEWVEVNKVFEQSPALEAGVQKGDLIVEVNGESVKGLSPAELAAKVKGEEGTTVRITFKRQDKWITLEIVRRAIQLSSVKQRDVKELMPDMNEALAEKICYVTINLVNANASEDLAPLLVNAKNQGVKELILDMRGNPGGYVREAIKICEMLVPEGPIFHSVKKDGSKTTYYSNLKEAPFHIILLIDSDSASSTEIIAGAVKDSGVGLLVGEQSFGKGVMQQMRDFEKDYGYKITTEEFLSRDEHSIHGVGITPDYEIYIPDLMSSPVRLYENDVHDSVLQLELILEYLGYKIDDPDTQYDSKTKEAVTRLQQESDLYSNGTCDFNTIQAVNEKLIESVRQYDPQMNKAFELAIESLKEGN